MSATNTEGNPNDIPAPITASVRDLLDQGITIQQIHDCLYNKDTGKDNAPDIVRDALNNLIATSNVVKSKEDAKAASETLHQALKDAKDGKASIQVETAAETLLKLKAEEKSATFQPLNFLDVAGVGVDLSHGQISLEEARTGKFAKEFDSLTRDQAAAVYDLWTKMLQTAPQRTNLAGIRDENNIKDADTLGTVLESGKIKVDGKDAPIAIPAWLRQALEEDQKRLTDLKQTSAQAQITQWDKTNRGIMQPLMALMRKIIVGFIMPFLKALAGGMHIADSGARSNDQFADASDGSTPVAQSHVQAIEAGIKQADAAAGGHAPAVVNGQNVEFVRNAANDDSRRVGMAHLKASGAEGVPVQTADASGRKGGAAPLPNPLQGTGLHIG
jgi:hypothetical protein